VESLRDEVARAEGRRLRRFTGRMSRLVGDLLDVVSMESGVLQLSLSEQDASNLVPEIMESFERTATARQLAMTSEVARGPVLARFDHDRILQVLTNLVGNAMKFTPVGGRIAVRLMPAPEGILFTVSDSGCGIAADQVEAMFERFAQVGEGVQRGLGLGLYIARCIVTAHGGKIWAESEPGKGSAFHFTLPPPAESA
jgi:signal transduction histidine kinase